MSCNPTIQTVCINLDCPNNRQAEKVELYVLRMKQAEVYTMSQRMVRTTPFGVTNCQLADNGRMNFTLASESSFHMQELAPKTGRWSQALCAFL